MYKSAKFLIVLIIFFWLPFIVNFDSGAKTTTPPPAPKPNDTFSVLILGTDQRGAEKNFRIDVNMVLILRPSIKKALVVSFPRDLNYGGRKINSIYPVRGFAYSKQAFSRITGLNVDRYVAVSGFNSFVWAVEQMNGLDVTVEKGFVDKQYPGDRENWGPITLEFKPGQQHMDGERALKYARSRKGNNGEGSDFARMKRQQNLLLSMPEAFLNNRKVLIPFGAQALLDLITGKIKTDLNVVDAANLYGYSSDFKNWKIEKLVVDPTNFVSTANPKNYGGAYTLLPKGGTYAKLKNFIYQKLQ